MNANDGSKISHDDYKQMSEEMRKEYNVYPKLQVYNVFNIDQTNKKEARPEMYEKFVADCEGAKPMRTDEMFCFGPLGRAVYLLFLRHEEGINFSFLPDYRDELLEIYRSLMNYRTTADIRKSIFDVTDPTNNSINEKCARIRRAFVSVLGKIKATDFYITGPRGEKR